MRKTKLIRDALAGGAACTIQTIMQKTRLQNRSRVEASCKYMVSKGELSCTGKGREAMYYLTDSAPAPAAGNSALPTVALDRKAVPIYSGVIKYFPRALAAIAECSKKGNDQHNPGKPLHWDRSKSGDELDALTRHLFDAGTVDTDSVRHSTKVAWRALANLEKELEGPSAGLSNSRQQSPRWTPHDGRGLPKTTAKSVDMLRRDQTTATSNALNGAFVGCWTWAKGSEQPKDVVAWAPIW